MESVTSVTEEILLVLQSNLFLLLLNRRALMLLKPGFKHFFEYVGSLLAVVTVTVDGGKLAYRAVQQSGGRSRSE